MNEFKVLNGYEVKDEEARSMLSEIGTFSSDETLTGQTWIDGKPIYRKIIDIGNLPDGSLNPDEATTKEVEHEIDFETIVRLDGFVKSRATGTGSKTVHNLPYLIAGNGDNGVEFYINATSVCVATKADRSLMVGYCIVEYTKPDTE